MITECNRDNIFYAAPYSQIISLDPAANQAAKGWNNWLVEPVITLNSPADKQTDAEPTS